MILSDQIKMEHVRDHTTDGRMGSTERIAAIENFENLNRVKLTTLQRFYTGAKLFITGGTGMNEKLVKIFGAVKIHPFLIKGFMGKMLLEKLLRTCTGIDTIYLLIRPKKDKDIYSRVDEIFDDLVSF